MTIHRDYVVTIQQFQWGVWGDVEVLDTFYAKDAAHARKQARAEMRNRGYTRQDGPVRCRAKLADNQPRTPT